MKQILIMVLMSILISSCSTPKKTGLNYQDAIIIQLKPLKIQKLPPVKQAKELKVGDTIRIIVKNQP